MALPRFEPDEIVRVVGPGELLADLPVEIGMVGRVVGSRPVRATAGWGWAPDVEFDPLAADEDGCREWPLPEGALESCGRRAMDRPGGGQDVAPLDPASRADAFWREITLTAYTAITHRREAEAAAVRVEDTLRVLGLFGRVELFRLERHWHAPAGRHPSQREYRLWFWLGADDAAAAFDHFVRSHEGGWTDDDDDGWMREAGWSADDDPATEPFLDPEVTHLSLLLLPLRDPHPRPVPHDRTSIP